MDSFILSPAVKRSTDRSRYTHIFRDSLSVLSLTQVEELCSEAERTLNETDFQFVLNALWKYAACKLRQEEADFMEKERESCELFS